MFFLLSLVPIGFILGTLARVHERSRQNPSPGRRPDLMLTGVLAGVLGVASWVVWLRGGSYYITPGAEVYEQWQFIGCGVSVVMTTIFLGWLSKWPVTGPFAAAFGSVVGFCAAWMVHAGSPNGVTHWDAVLLVLSLAGYIGLGVVAMIVAGVRSVANRSRPALVSPTLGDHEGNCSD